MSLLRRVDSSREENDDVVLEEIGTSMNGFGILKDHSWELPVDFSDSEGVFAIGVEAVEDDEVSFDSGELVHRESVNAFCFIRVVNEIAAASHFHDDSHLVLDGYEEASVEDSFDELSQFLRQWHM